MATIYALVDSSEVWNWRYIGRTIQPLHRRVYHHKYRATFIDKGIHKSRWIRSVLAAGNDVLGIALEDCDDAIRAEREVAWIELALRAGFPLCNMSDWGGTPTQPGDEVRAKIAAALRGRTRPPHVVEAARRNGLTYVGAKNPNFGNRWNEQQRSRMSTQRAGTKLGETNHSARISAADVIEIRRLASAGESFRSISQQFPISPQSVSNIVNRLTWRHVQ